MKLFFVFISFFIWVSCQSSVKPEFHSIVNLDGYWKFNIGDDMNWAQRGFDDNDWDSIMSSRKWEEQGYVGYDGFAWYRKKINVPETKYGDHLYLSLGRIDDVNEVYFNGTRVGQMGLFPPNYESAYNASLLYAIPKELINFNDENLIAVRVYDNGDDGGFLDDKQVLGYDEDVDLLNVNLAGAWKIAFDHNSKFNEINYDDSHWDRIRVPASWESQGYNNYNGDACYRLNFNLDDKLEEERLYLILGMIDDVDSVYVNGKLIGTTKDLYNTFVNKNVATWRLRRAYKIPLGLLNFNGLNTISVLVTDNLGMGGIHEGVVGLMTRKQYDEYVDRHEGEIPFFMY